MYLERFNLKGRVAVVTGGGQGIGLACVEALLEAGAQVYIADRNAEAGAEGRAAMKAKGYVAEVIEMEVTDSKQVDAAAAKVKELGGNVLAPAMDINEQMRIAIVQDPQGAVFALYAGPLED